MSAMDAVRALQLRGLTADEKIVLMGIAQGGRRPTILNGLADFIEMGDSDFTAALIGLLHKGALKVSVNDEFAG